LHKPHLRLGIKIKPPKRALLSGFYFHSELFTIKISLKTKCLRRSFLSGFILMLKTPSLKTKPFNQPSKVLQWNNIVN